MKELQPTTKVCAAIAFLLATVSGCSPDFQKADADKEVYQIIDEKWRPAFGQKVNYVISDANAIPSPNDVNVEKPSISAEPLSLAQAAAIATKYNRDYQSRKEDLYLSALALTGERYKYALKWFGTIDAKYARGIDDRTGIDYEDTSLNAQGGVKNTLLLPDEIMVNSSLAIDWVRFLTGDPRTTLGSVLSGTLAVPLLGSGAGKVAWEDLTQKERDV
ncbi:MAG: hypothetical protein MUO27_04820, partial [Sedimentisphaerales bacterium]|nr:hypothetical protein [Sedimentisphaerales bacterium]